jgi:hypothetical protein
MEDYKRIKYTCDTLFFSLPFPLYTFFTVSYRYRLIIYDEALSQPSPQAFEKLIYRQTLCVIANIHILHVAKDGT